MCAVKKSERITLEIANSVLESFGQKIKFLSIEKGCTQLSVGEVLTNTERLRLFSLINAVRKNKREAFFLKYFDRYYSGEEDRTTLMKEIRAEVGKNGASHMTEESIEKMKRAKLGVSPWNKGLTCETHPQLQCWSKGLTKEDSPILAKLSADRMGANNPSHRMTEESKNSMKEKLSRIMKDKVASGEFTPPVVNTMTRRSAVVCNRNFRSSWECLFWYFNQHLEYETIRIPYALNGENKTYIVDFFDRKTNTIFEIKPASKTEEEIFKIKQNAARKYAEINNMTVSLVSDEEIADLFPLLREEDKRNFDSHQIYLLNKHYEATVKKRNRKAGDNL